MSRMLYNSGMSVDLQPIARFFWDQDIASLNWEQHRNFIVRRLLQYGDLQSLRWLRSQIGDEGLRDWIVKRNGRGLDPRQIRYWALILNINSSLADEWVETSRKTLWEQRR